MKYLILLRKLLFVLFAYFNGYNNDNYIAYLEIPKIEFKQGLYAKDNIKNNIEYNIAYHEESDYFNTIIMGHSGSASISYFENLKYLDLNDIIYYNNYEYVIDDIYKVKKTGYLDLIREYDRQSLTLITCLDQNYQLVIVAYKK